MTEPSITTTRDTPSVRRVRPAFLAPAAVFVVLGIVLGWGVYGVPETYVIGKDGCIAYKHIGAVTPETLPKTILPLIGQLRRSQVQQAGGADGGSATPGREPGQ